METTPGESVSIPTVEPQDRMSPIIEFLFGAGIVLGPMLIIDLPARRASESGELNGLLLATGLFLVGLAFHRISTPAMLVLLTAGYTINLVYVSGPSITLDVLPWAAYLIGRWGTTACGVAVLIIGAGTATAGGLLWGEWEADMANATVALSLWLTPPVTALFVFTLTLAAYFVGRSAAQLASLNIATLEASWQAQHQARARLEARAINAVTSTRLEISRELHDILAHSLSLIVVQANGARLSAEEHPEVASATLEHISEVASEALAEIRAIIGGLRSSQMASQKNDERIPQPGLDDIQELVDDSAGKATLRVSGEPPPVSAMLALTIYRVAQEALTNFRKHAPADSKVVVTLTYSPEWIEIDITNDGGSESSTQFDETTETVERTGGNGLFGMHERVTAAGGQLETGSLPDGGFRVHAWTPVPQSEDAQTTGI